VRGICPAKQGSGWRMAYCGWLITYG